MSAPRRRVALAAAALAVAGGACRQAPPPATPGPVDHVAGAATPGDGASAPPAASPVAPASPTAPDASVATKASAPGSAPAPAGTADPAAAAAGFDPARTRLVLEPVWDGFHQPVLVTGAGDGSGRRFVVERDGLVRLVAGGAVRARPYLDLRDRVGSGASEQGLLGLAFHPRFADTGRLFVDYTDRAGDTVVAELRAAPDAEAVESATERIILRVPQPAANHNGGHVAFGPDGMLYVGLGDGGGANDAFGNGQRPDTLLAKILRLDVDGVPEGDAAYAVPPDNPFVGVAPFRPETWAWGLRNPWRFAFDGPTGALYIGDVGQGAWEEIDVAPGDDRGGRNYGWPLLEGARCLDGGGPPESCGAGGLLEPPVATYGHDEGCSVSGGVVVRDQAVPELDGVYLYGDFCSGRIWGLWRGAAGGWRSALLDDTERAIASFGVDDGGAAYVVDYGGAILRVRALGR